VGQQHLQRKLFDVPGDGLADQESAVAVDGDADQGGGVLGEHGAPMLRRSAQRVTVLA
jgi:hypothetical protein